MAQESVPEYLCVLITKHNNVSVRTRRAKDCYLMNVPPISKYCTISFFEHSFMYAALFYGQDQSRY